MFVSQRAKSKEQRAKSKEQSAKAVIPSVARNLVEIAAQAELPRGIQILILFGHRQADVARGRH